MFCPNCGKDAGESKFCPECGTEVIVNKSSHETNDTNDKPKKKKSKAMGCGIIVAILIAIIAAGIMIPKFAEKKANSKAYIEISDTEIGLNDDLLSDISIISFKYNIKNISDKTIESMTIHFSIYNDEGIEKATIKYVNDIILKPGESTDPTNFDYWKFYAYKSIAGYELEFKDVVIDGVYTVDYKSIKITSIDLKFSDETTETQNLDYAIDKIYLRGLNGDVFYYVKRNEEGFITEQCSKVLDENGAWDIPEEERYDDPYYQPVK